MYCIEKWTEMNGGAVIKTINTGDLDLAMDSFMQELGGTMTDEEKVTVRNIVSKYLYKHGRFQWFTTSIKII